jgi:hypothetical protein
MPSQTWSIVIAVAIVVCIVFVVLWLRMPVYRWYCRHCKKISSSGRFHPRKCGCGSPTLVAYYCSECKSWNTTPISGWHCAACRSKEILLGVEYNLATAMWRWRNRTT